MSQATRCLWTTSVACIAKLTHAVLLLGVNILWDALRRRLACVWVDIQRGRQEHIG